MENNEKKSKKKISIKGDMSRRELIILLGILVIMVNMAVLNVMFYEVLNEDRSITLTSKRVD